jgi:HEAT repeat protein
LASNLSCRAELKRENMNEILEILSGGTLQSDGRANEAADIALTSPVYFAQLVEGLSDHDDVIRARTAHALERISRSQPGMASELLVRFAELALNDRVPMVRWHMAMILGNLPLSIETEDLVFDALFHLLADPAVFVKSWAIVSLTMLGRKQDSRRGEICGRLARLQGDKSPAIRSKVLKALKILVDENEPLPGGWVKACN